PTGAIITTIPSGGINPAGAPTGRFYDGVMGHGYLQSPDGIFTSFDPPGSIDTFPFAINPAGAVTGFYVDASTGPHGSLRAPNGTITPFDPGSTFTLPVAVTPVGVITGAFSDASGVAHGFLRTRKRIRLYHTNLKSGKALCRWLGCLASWHPSTRIQP